MHLRDRLDNSQLAKASWYQRKRWHHLQYLTRIASLRVRH